MDLLTKILLFAGLMLLLLLTVIAAYSYSQIRILSLPISQIFAIVTIILPFANALSAQTAYRLVRSHASHTRPILFLAIFAFQLIYETIIATLSLTYMVPNCRLEEQWARLYGNKDEGAIRRIQERFNCCGFNTVVDRAWPFPHGRPEDGYGADQCKRMFGRGMPCSGSWRQAEQINAGMFFTVAIIILVLKFILFAFQLSNTSRRVRFFGSLTSSILDAHPNSRASVRLAIGEGAQVAAGEQYHDESDDGQEEIATAEHANENGTRPRVEIVTSGGGELWGEEA